MVYEHERTGDTFLVWLSDVGGLKDAIVLILSPIAAIVSNLSFKLSITNSMPTIFPSLAQNMSN